MIAFRLASFEWVSAIEAVVLVVVSLALCWLARVKHRKLKPPLRIRKLAVWVDGQRHYKNNARPRSTTIARLTSTRRFPAG
jgi:hypothetical protein